MGEYAKFNGGEIKIGTCECMYYLRYDDRGRVDPVSGNVNPQTTSGLFFRLPFPDEDDQLPGSYSPYSRGYRLGRKEKEPSGEYWRDWQPVGMEDSDAGVVQLKHEASGLLLNVPCHHGAKLPDVGNGMKAFWNGKCHALELRHVKSMPDGSLRPVYACRFCDSIWSADWEDILPYCGLDREMQARLEMYASLGVSS